MKSKRNRIQTSMNNIKGIYAEYQKDRIQSSLEKQGRKSKKLKSFAKLKLKSTNKVIGYNQMMDDGTCTVMDGLYSRTMEFSDKSNYLTATDEKQNTIFDAYCALLDETDPSTHLQINLINRFIDTEEYRKAVSIPLQGNNQDVYREELSKIYDEKITQGGKNNLIRQKYLTIATKESSYEAAIPSLNRIQNNFKNKLENDLECVVNSLNGLQRLELIHNHFNPHEPFTFSYDMLAESGLSTRDFVAPSSLDFHERSRYRFSDDYIGQVLFIQELPAVELKDKFISDITYLPIEMNFSIHMKIIDKEDALEIVGDSNSWIEKEVESKEDKARQKRRNVERSVNLETRRSHLETLLWRERLEKENMFVVSMLIYTYSKDEEELAENVKRIKGAARRHGVKFNTLDFRQVEGMNSVLPLGYNYTDIERSLLTWNLGTLTPFTTQELFQLSGHYYGQIPHTKSIVKYDRRLADNPNGIILGQTGSGKDFIIKKVLGEIRLRGENDDIIVIDYDRHEYTRLAKALGGTVIRLAPGSPDHVNPLDISLNYGKEDQKDMSSPLDFKINFIWSMCELFLKRDLTAAEQSIIDRASTLIYADFFARPYSAAMPTLKELFECIKAQPEEEAEKIALDLELYTKGSFNMFSHQTNVNNDDDFIVYDIMDLGEQMKPLGMLFVLDQIENRIKKNTVIGRNTWVVISEMQNLLIHPRAGKFLKDVWSRARKWGCIPTGITQILQNMEMSEDAKAMLKLSDFHIIFKMDSHEAAEIGDILQLSSDVVNRITKLKNGEAFLCVNKNPIEIYDKFPKDTKMYQLINTDTVKPMATPIPAVEETPVTVVEPIATYENVIAWENEDGVMIVEPVKEKTPEPVQSWRHINKKTSEDSE